MKYVVDIDALKACLEYTVAMKVNSKPMCYLDDVLNFIDRFPKDQADIDLEELIVKMED